MSSRELELQYLLYLFSGYFLSHFIKQLRCHESRSPDGGSPHPQCQPCGHLADTVVSNFDPDIPGLSDPHGATVVGRGKVPDKDVG